MSKLSSQSAGRSIDDFFTKYLHCLFCAIAFFLCELVAKPYADFGVSDEWSYVQTARILAATGKIVYNGWATAMLGWQLFPAAFLIRHFGSSYTVTRMLTLVTAVLSTALLQRIFVRSGLNERNATIGTLSLSLSPIYMQLSVTFMSDTYGVFAILLCLYGCLRAVEATTQYASGAWIVAAAVANALVGSSRQLAWLGVIVIVPSALWVMRRRRGVLLVGIISCVACDCFVVWCLHWFKAQPFSIVEPLFVPVKSLHDVTHSLRELSRALLELPLLMIGLVVAFLPFLKRGRRPAWIALAVGSLLYTAVAIKLLPSHGPGQLLQPLLHDWISPYGFYGPNGMMLASPAPVVLGTIVRILLTIISFLAGFAILLFVLNLREIAALKKDDQQIASDKLNWLLVPYLVVYSCLLIPRSFHEIFDRYLIGITPFLAILLIRVYQDRVQPKLPTYSVVVIAVVALFGVGTVHDLFAYDRARVKLANEVVAAGNSDLTIDAGFEYDDATELKHIGFLNDDRLTNPAGVYVAMDRHRALSCDGKGELDDHYRHGVPIYGFAFDPQACAGPAAFSPVSYPSWLRMRNISMYVVKYQRR